MGMTLTEKILAKASGRTKVEPGENIWVDTDVLMTHDVWDGKTRLFRHKIPLIQCWIMRLVGKQIY
jgi:homoaconitase/3-isopropylmalate dehydratase large subunit